MWSQFRQLSRNPRSTIALIPLWSIPHAIYAGYTMLYASHMGVSATELGILSSASFAVRFIASFFAGTTVNRLGRKRTVVTFDIFSWILPLVIWACSQNFWYFLVAAAFNSLGAIGGVSNQCLLIEDTTSDQKLFVYRLHDAMNTAAGFFAPLAGLMIGIMGFVPAMRIIYVIGFILMALMDIFKVLLLKDNQYGLDSGRSIIITAAAKDALKAWRYISKKPVLYKVLIQSYLFSFAQVFVDVYYYLFITNNLGISESAVSAIPFVNAAVVLTFLVFILPKLSRTTGIIWPGVALHVSGSVVLMLTSLNPSLPLVLLNTLLWAAGRAYLNPILQSKIASEIDENVRANITSLTNMISILFMLPAGMVGALLYKSGHLLPFVLVFSIYLIVLVLQPLLSSSHKRSL